ncbi:hypothetical protein F2Q69_00046172 [Brassica cretica]|uniref:Uncharacterized protein n=1 Tax=Brassica cretica TaxID=69181 RepID=A0A8S9Q4L2_BRACR|nr:hypothetical protein F2Q69_00046172 [Brassica cretica]
MFASSAMGAEGALSRASWRCSIIFLLLRCWVRLHSAMAMRHWDILEVLGTAPLSNGYAALGYSGDAGIRGGWVLAFATLVAAAMIEAAVSSMMPSALLCRTCWRRASLSTGSAQLVYCIETSASSCITSSVVGTRGGGGWVVAHCKVPFQRSHWLIERVLSFLNWCIGKSESSPFQSRLFRYPSPTPTTTSPSQLTSISSCPPQVAVIPLIYKTPSSDLGSTLNLQNRN